MTTALMNVMDENAFSRLTEESDMNDSLVQVRLFDELTEMVNQEMKRFGYYIDSISDDCQDIKRLTREDLSKRITKEAFVWLTEIPQEEMEEGEFYFLLDPYGLLCGIAKRSDDGSLQRVDTITIRKLTLRGLRHNALKALFDEMGKQFKELMQVRSDKTI